MPEADRRMSTQGGLPVVSLDAWARSIEESEPKRETRGVTLPDVIRYELPIEMRAIDVPGKTITIVAGTSGVDRYRDRILIAGYDDTQFRRNPIMPWCHSYWDLPVAQGLNPRVEGDAYVLEASFADTSMIYPFAAMVWQMYAARILRMASVGGMPTTWLMDETRRGMDVTGFDLWEVSLCPLGVNPDAMAKARLNSIDTAPLDAWARQVLDEGGSIFLPKARAEALVKTLGYGKGLALFELEPDALLKLRASLLPTIDEELQEMVATVREAHDVTGGMQDLERHLSAALEALRAEKPRKLPKAEGEEEEEHPPEEMPMEDEDDKPKEEAAGEPAEDEPVEACADDEEYTLDLEALEEEIAAAADADAEEEVEVDEEELKAIVAGAIAAAIAEHGANAGAAR